jgi:hypothetical protein
MGRHHYKMDRIENEQGGQMCEGQGWLERTGWQVICSAPTATTMGQMMMIYAPGYKLIIMCFHRHTNWNTFRNKMESMEAENVSVGR